MRIFLRLFLVLLLLPITLHAQFFSAGQDAASTKWLVAKNNQFQIIFPVGYKPLALRFATYISGVAHSDSLHFRCSLPIVLHPWNPNSNGFVTLVPRRMELYTIPPQDIYPQDWLKQLAAHEFQHSLQMEELNHGMVRLFTYPLGEQAWGAALSFTPLWFLEGDAVVSETRFSKSGRGRLPSFEQGHRAAFLSGKKYTYDKWLMGSYRDYIPDHYEFGYKLVSYVNMKYGEAVWRNVMGYTARNPYTLAPFYFGLKKYAGISREQLYDKAFNFLDSIWMQEDHLLKPMEGATLPTFEKTYTDYSFPKWLNDTTIIAYKSGLKKTASIVSVSIRTGAEEQLLVTGRIFDPISYASGVVAWDDYGANIRWEQQGKSRINLFRLKDKKKSVIYSCDQLFSPALDGDGKKIVAVSVDRNGIQQLSFYDVGSGSFFKSVDFPLGTSLQTPSWNSDKLQVVFTTVTTYGKALCVYSFKKDTVITLLRSQVADIATPIFFNGYIVFSSFSGSVNNIYALDTSTHQLFRITNSRFGAQYPSAANNGIVYSKYTANGYRAAILNEDVINKVPISIEELGYHSPLEAHISASSKSDAFDTTIVSNFSIEPYRRGLHLFNFHSWAPFFYDPLELSPNTAEFAPGFTIMSQNILSTTLSVLGYSYENGFSQFHARFIYQGWFPVFSFSADYGAYPLLYHNSAAKTIPTITTDRLDLNGVLSLPFNFSSGKVNRSMIPSVGVGHTNDYLYNRSDSSYSRDYATSDFRFYFYSAWELASRDIRPRWGRILDFRFHTALFENENIGSITSILFRQMLPGIAVNHSLMLSFGVQKQHVKNYYLSSYLIFPRGYVQQVSKKLKTISLDYAFPLAYPDWAIPNLAYIQRIRLNAFFDLAQNSYDVYDPVQKKRVTINPVYYSFGIDVGFDYHLFRNAFPLSTQIRLGETRNNEPFFNLFFGITFN